MSKSIRARVFNVMQYERNPFTGEMLVQFDADGNVLKDENGDAVDFGLNEMKISSALQHKSVARFAYICHDKDVFSEEDFCADSRKITGTRKPRHWHVVVEFKNAVDIDVLARWFGIPPQYIEVAKGGNRAFLDCVEYLTHERHADKAHYDDECVHANFDFRAALDGRQKNGGRELNSLEEYLSRVMFGEMTAKQVGKVAPVLYVRHQTEFRNARAYYLQNIAERPISRQNFYICGGGGEGKSLASRALARSLFPGLLNDDDIFFEVGAKNVAFDTYDGQPVIIWNDFRSIEFFKYFENRGNVFNLLETHPSRGGGGMQNVKFGHVRLINSVNIINSVQEYPDFLNGLIGEYTDRDGVVHAAEMSEKSQAFRRIGCIIPLHADDFDVLLNKGLVNGSREFCDYYHFARVRGNFRKIAVACAQNEELARQIEQKMLAPVAGDVQKLLSAASSASDAELSALMSYGEVIPVADKFQKQAAEYFGENVQLREIFLNWSRWLGAGFDPEALHMIVVLVFGGVENVPSSFSEYVLSGFPFDENAVQVVSETGEKLRRVVEFLASQLNEFIVEHNMHRVVLDDDDVDDVPFPEVCFDEE